MSTGKFDLMQARVQAISDPNNLSGRTDKLRDEAIAGTSAKAKSCKEWFNYNYDQWKADLTPHEKAAISAALVVGFKFGGDPRRVCIPGFGVFMTSHEFDPEDMGDVDRFPERVGVLMPEKFYTPMQVRAQRLLHALLQSVENELENRKLLEGKASVDENLKLLRAMRQQSAIPNKPIVYKGLISDLWPWRDVGKS